MSDIYCDMCSKSEILLTLNTADGLKHEQILAEKYTIVTNLNIGRGDLKAYCTRCYDILINSGAGYFKIKEITKEQFIKLEVFE